MSGPVVIVIVVVASFLSGIVKAVTGLGYALFAVPIIALGVGVADAVVIVAVPNLVSNGVLCWAERGSMDQTRDLPAMLSASIVGAFVGTFLLVVVPEEPLVLLLLATIAAFVVSSWRSPDFQLRPPTTARLAPGVGFGIGLMQGAVGAPGPVAAIWLRAYRLDPRAYVFAIAALFAVPGLVQLLLLGGSGQIDGERAGMSALACVPLALALPVGWKLRTRLSGPAFDMAVLAVLVVSGLALVPRLVS